MKPGAERQELTCKAQSFQGYHPPTSNTTYTPNQFFDVVLSTASRGCVRLVAFLIRKTLGWSDSQGNPQNPTAQVAYRELERQAGIGMGRIKAAIDEAMERKFIDLIEPGNAHSRGSTGASAIYSLRWGTRDEYITSPADFDGFFSGNGNLTHIPNQFFDWTVPSQTLALSKVVGVIIRHTIGFQTRYGFRRQEVKMSFTQIMRRAGIRSRSSLCSALDEAIASNHVCVISKGVFDRNAGLSSTATTYGIRWEKLENPAEGLSPEPLASNASGIAPAATQSRSHLSLASPPKTNRTIASRIESGTHLQLDRKRLPNRTAIKTTDLNNTSKQQADAGSTIPDSANRKTSLISELTALGVSRQTATKLTASHTEDQIRRQLNWLPYRSIRSNRAGFLIKAIQDDIAQPLSSVDASTPASIFVAAFYAELAGNKGEPLATPSPAELLSSRNLLARLGRMQPPGSLGRELARLAIRRSNTARIGIQTLSLALRLCADQMVAEDARAHCSTGCPSGSLKREEHECQMLPKFLQHVEQSIRIAEPDRDIDGEFSAYEAERLRSAKRISTKGHEILCRQLGAEDGRAQIRLDFLRRGWPQQVPDFWSWDRATNDAPFKPGRV